MPVLENFGRAFSPDPTDCPWVSEDACAIKERKKRKRVVILQKFIQKRIISHGLWANFFFNYIMEEREAFRFRKLNFLYYLSVRKAEYS